MNLGAPDKNHTSGFDKRDNNAYNVVLFSVLRRVVILHNFVLNLADLKTIHALLHHTCIRQQAGKLP